MKWKALVRKFLRMADDEFPAGVNPEERPPARGFDEGAVRDES